MPILAGDIKVVASKVMQDVVEGGGPPTSTIILDGQSNSIFRDISELDRAIGNVSLQKVFLHVQTNDKDSYLGTNVVVAEPPEDPNVSVVIIQVEAFFSERDDAKTRVESYLAPGTTYAGYLFGDLLQGQRNVTICQREEALIPNIGDTLVLRKRSGFSDEATQFVRVSAVSAAMRTFIDESGSYNMRIVVLTISDILVYDFPGFNATRIDPSFEARKIKTIIFEAVVADAARYYSAVPLEEAVSIGDFNIKTASIYAKIVPSAQIETPIADSRTNGLSSALVPSGGDIVQTFNLNWSPTQQLFVGGGITPGSLSIVTSGLTITDNGGTLRQAGTVVGAVDYENGILTLSVNLFNGATVTHVITYTPAASATLVERSQGIPITINNRSLSYVITLAAMARKTLMVSYFAGGKWYILHEDGSGKVAGSDSAFGIGNMNFVTSTLTLTLGALPDSGSSIILQWAEAQSSRPATNVAVPYSTRLFAPINTDGNVSLVPGSKQIFPSSLTLAWIGLAGATKTATDNGLGVLSGDAVGTVDYLKGIVYFSPNVLPAKDTIINFTNQVRVAQNASGLVWSGAGLTRSSALPPDIGPNTFSYSVYFEVTPVVAGAPEWLGQPSRIAKAVQVTDNGSGGLLCGGLACGTINYTTGAITIDFSAYTPAQIHAAIHFEPVLQQYRLGVDGYVYAPQRIGTPAELGVTVTFTALVLYVGSLNEVVTFSTAGLAANPISVAIGSYMAKVDFMAPGFTLQGVDFKLGTSRFVGSSAGVLIRDIDPATGIGTPVGTVNSALGSFTMETWVPGITSIVTNARGFQAPPITGIGDVSGNVNVVFRVALAPIRPGSFSLIGTMEDGTSINTTAGINGKISHARVKGRINYETGVVEIVFVNPVATSLGTANLTYMSIPGVTTVNLDTVIASTLRYNAVGYTYVPLDANLIGIDPVRLPSDGRVPIIRAGSVIVVGNTGTVAAATVVNAQVVNCGRTRLSRVRVIGNDGVTIITGYTTDLEAGTITFTNVEGYSQPVTVEHRIEDMALVADAQINGEIRVTRPMTHNYSVLGSYVSSALLLGNTATRVSILFDQSTWDQVTWSDILVGNAAAGTYNDTANPFVLTNRGTVTERWVLRFTSTTQYQIIGEHVGVIGTGDINTITQPINPATGVPYFIVNILGWGIGWSVGNILRFNTIGAMFPIWLVRTVQQGPETVINDRFSLLVRGDVNRP